VWCIQTITPSVISPQPSWELQNSTGLRNSLHLTSPSSTGLAEVITITDALSWQRPASTSMTYYVASGLPIPAPLQQAIRTTPVVQGTQATISAFPSHTHSDLHVLQEADPAIKEFLKFWTQQKRPDSVERRQVSKETLLLAKQWDRIQDQDGVLFRQVCDPERGEVLQLVLPRSLKSQVLSQLHDEHGH